MTRPSNNYSFREVKGLVRGVSTMLEHRDNKDVHVKLIDLTRALYVLWGECPDEADIILIHGIHHIDFRDAEELLMYPRSTLSDWYTSGLKKLTAILNGELI